MASVPPACPHTLCRTIGRDARRPFRGCAAPPALSSKQITLRSAQHVQAQPPGSSSLRCRPTTMQQRHLPLLVLLAAAVILSSAAAVAAAAEKEGAAAADLSAAPQVKEEPAAQKTGTDAAAPEREAAGKMSSPGFQAKIRSNAKKYEFQAEVNRLMDILIHSLYSNKDIFLRELISNASDALDKLRFLALTDKSVLGEGDTAKLDISIWADKPSRTLFIRDRGVGMTQDELVKNLGTIAKSGTSAFLEAMQKGGDVNLIGQFGVGFYSVYLVADWVEVVTRAHGHKQYIWSSGADGAFSVAEDEGEHEDLGRGTLIKIHLKEGEEEYADQARLQGLVSRYSEFIDFPIYLQTTTEKDVPVEEEEEAAAEGEKKSEEAEEKSDEGDDAEDDEEGDVIDDGDDDGDGASGAAAKTVKRNVTEWSHLNGNKAIWLRKASDISEGDYNSFYKAVSKDYEDPLARVHFSAEGDVEFKALLFIPQRAPWDFYDNIQRPKQPAGSAGAGGSPGLKLYVRRVFISDDADELLPRWLSFVRGVVDSDSLPLNVNRETLQAHSSLRTIKKKLVRKVLDAIKRMADTDAKCDAADKAGKEAGEKPEGCGQYAALWKEFGRALKLGAMEDNNNRARLAKLLRFHSSKSRDALTSLDAYVSRLQPGQKAIYWIAGMSQAEVSRSPFAEKLVAEGYEVLYCTDVLDEYVMQQLPDYEDHKLVNIAKEDIEHLDKDDSSKKGDKKGDKKKGDSKGDKDAKKSDDKALREAFKPLTSWWKEQLAGKVSGVKLSRRLASTPAVVVAGKWGASAHMEKIMKASAFSDPSRAAAMRGARTLEINPAHPLIVALRDKVASDASDAGARAAAALLYETALLESGFDPEDPKAFTRQMYDLMGGQLLGLDPTEATGTAAAAAAGASADKAAAAAAAGTGGSSSDGGEAAAAAAAADEDDDGDSDKSEL